MKTKRLSTNAILFRIGLAILFIGAITLDSEGKGYIFSLTCSVIGMIITSITLFIAYEKERRYEDDGLVL